MIRATFVLLMILISAAIALRAQTATISPRSISPAPVPGTPAAWAGWAQCQIDTTGTGYTDRQTHTWVLTAAAPAMQGVFAIHAATWTAVGSGSAQRTSGSQPSQAQWTTNVNGINAPLAISVRASDKRMVIRPWHDRLGASTGIKGTEQATATITTLRTPAPTPLAFQAWSRRFRRLKGMRDRSSVDRVRCPPTGRPHQCSRPGRHEPRRARGSSPSASTGRGPACSAVRHANDDDGRNGADPASRCDDRHSPRRRRDRDVVASVHDADSRQATGRDVSGF